MREIKVKFINDVPWSGDFWQGISKMYVEQLSKSYKVIISDMPDYLFVYCHRAFDVPENIYHRYENCVRCQIITENVRPDFDSFDYAIGPYHDLAYGKRYLYLPYHLLQGGNSTSAWCYQMKDVLNKHKCLDLGMSKRAFCCFVSSNLYGADYEREFFLRKLSKYKKVDCGGKVFNNIGKSVDNVVGFTSGYKFSIAFENVWQSFVSEKICNSFAAKTVPIYWGNPSVGELYNHKAFLNCHDFDSFDEVVDKIVEIDSNDEEYMQMLSEPAIIDEKDDSFYIGELNHFLRRIIDLPLERAIMRTDSYFSYRKQRGRVMGERDVYEYDIWRDMEMMNNSFDKRIRL